MAQRLCLIQGAGDDAAHANLQQTWADLPPPASIPHEQGRSCQVSEALLLPFLFSRGGRASGLKAACQLQKGSLYPPILLLETPSLVFALKGPEGDQVCEGPHFRGSRAQAWPLLHWHRMPCVPEGHLAPFGSVETPKPIPACLPVSPQQQSGISLAL